jgi:hypothetical protein
MFSACSAIHHGGEGPRYHSVVSLAHGSNVRTSLARLFAGVR